MVVVKVRETYDLHTTKNKMTVIAIHTPKPDILKRNYPGLLMQCKSYRPLKADVRIACASMMPLDVQSVGTAPGDVAPEDVFNPILYKAMSNFGMSQLEARINGLFVNNSANVDVSGNTASVDVDSVTTETDDFNLYYGLLAETHSWKHASAQAGLSMSGLRPLVYEILYNVGDNAGSENLQYAYPATDGNVVRAAPGSIRGNAKPMPFINCTSYSFNDTGSKERTGESAIGFPNLPWSAEVDVPYLKVICGAIIVPPSRLHSLYFRMVVEWDIEFSMIRPISDILSLGGVADLGAHSHYQNYSYESTKEVVTGTKDSALDQDTCMVSSNVEVTKVM